MLTTVQGVIAEELDAYEDVSWFTSAYLVCFPAQNRSQFQIATFDLIYLFAYNTKLQ